MRGAQGLGRLARLVPQGRGSAIQARPHQAQVLQLWALWSPPGHLPTCNAGSQDWELRPLPAEGRGPEEGFGGPRALDSLGMAVP